MKGGLLLEYLSRNCSCQLSKAIDGAEYTNKEDYFGCGGNRVLCEIEGKEVVSSF
jgi:hypothetical protein